MAAGLVLRSYSHLDQADFVVFGKVCQTIFDTFQLILNPFACYLFLQIVGDTENKIINVLENLSQFEIGRLLTSFIAQSMSK